MASASHDSLRGFGFARLNFDVMASAWLRHQQWRGSGFVKLRRDGDSTFGSTTMELTGFGSSSDMSFSVPLSTSAFGPWRGFGP